MKYITFPAAGKLTALAIMLECFGHDTDDQTIALHMRAPWLFVKEDDRYLAGSSLYQPRWLDLYLTPHGFHMTEISLPKDHVPAFLRSVRTAMLPLKVTQDQTHPVVFTGSQGGRYLFCNVKQQASSEPDNISLTTAMLKRRLTEIVSVSSLEECQPATVDFVPLLLESINNLTHYQHDVLQALKKTVTRDEFQMLSKQLFRALMQDALPMAQLGEDFDLTNELLLLNHDYRHVFTRNSPCSVTLVEKIPRGSVRKCVSWLREDIIDQLYLHGLSDDAVEKHLCHLTYD